MLAVNHKDGSSALASSSGGATGLGARTEQLKVERRSERAARIRIHDHRELAPRGVGERVHRTQQPSLSRSLRPGRGRPCKHTSDHKLERLGRYVCGASICALAQRTSNRAASARAAGCAARTAAHAAACFARRMSG